jgi:hypothetical protein
MYIQTGTPDIAKGIGRMKNRAIMAGLREIKCYFSDRSILFCTV